MATITLNKHGFSFNGPLSAKGHFKINAGDTDVEFILGTDWKSPQRPIPATVTLPSNVFKDASVQVDSHTSAVKAELVSSPSGDGEISCSTSDISVGTLQGQIDVVPKGGGQED